MPKHGATHSARLIALQEKIPFDAERILAVPAPLGPLAAA
jgi:hypothetical protein